MKQKLNKLFIMGMTALAFTACTSAPDQTGSEYINHIKISNNKAKFDYVVTFEKSLEVEGEGDFAVGKYGDIQLFTNNDGLFSIGFHANLELGNSPDLVPVDSLPNGARFPAIVTGSLGSVLVQDVPNKYKLYAYFDTNANAVQRLAGVAMELNGIGNNFPQISVSQSFFTTGTNKKFSTFTIYGPRVVNGVQKPGGIFMVGDVNMPVDQSTGIASNKALLYGPDAAKYQSDYEKYNLYRELEEALDDYGIHLNFL